MPARFRDPPPFAHQAREFESWKDAKSRALLWQMRSGKSRACVDLASYLYTEGKITGVLVIAPNGVHVDWVIKHFPSFTWTGVPTRLHAWRSAAAHWPKFQREDHDRRLADMFITKHVEWLSVMSVNSEALPHERVQKMMGKFVRRHTGKLLLIVDEVDDCRTPSSDRSRIVRGLTKHCASIRILSGTVASNSLLHLWAPYEILEHGALGYERFTDFKYRYAEYRQTTTRGGRTFPTLSGYKNENELRTAVANWSSVVLRSDCVDLPDIMPVERTVMMDDDALRVFLELKRTLIADLREGRIVEALEGGKRLIKLQQCQSGWVIDDAFNVVTLGKTNPRLDALRFEVDMTPGKVLVWCQFREDIRRVCAALREDGHGVVEYHGGIAEKDKHAARLAFAESPRIKALVGHPRAGGRGLDLSAGGATEAIIWYSSTPDLIVYDQANERATVVGGRSMPIVSLTCRADSYSVDTHFMDMRNRKRDTSDFVVGLGLRELLEALEQ